MYYRLAFSALLCAGLLGCATTPTPTAAAVNVPASRILAPSFLEKQDGLGLVVIKRDEGFSASACNTRIFVNGQPVADISTGEKVSIYLPEGEAMLAAQAKGICIGGLVEAKVMVTKNRATVFRVSYGSSGEFSLQPTAF